MFILLKSPEITLKGRNQGDFWARLRDNVRHYLRRGGIDWPVNTARRRLQVEVPQVPPVCEEGVDEAVRILERVAGVDTILVAERLPPVPDRPLIEDAVIRLAHRSAGADRTFAVRAHRVDKKFPLSSTELEIWLGDVIRQRTEWKRVRLKDPDRTFYVDVQRDGVYLYDRKEKGTGGLPVGTSGRVLSLLSGGIDSPVASYLMARRGAAVDFFHMSAARVTEGDFQESVIGRLVRQLSLYTMRSRLFVVPYTHFDLALAGETTGYEAVLFRRFLFRVAEALAKRIGASALVTGDSLSQVSSQTMANLVASTKAVEMLVLRPLVGLDKQEIMALGRRIGSYPISIEPYKDCCALFSRGARTRTEDADLTALENRRLPRYAEMVARSLDEAVRAEYDCGALTESVPAQPARW